MAAIDDRLETAAEAYNGAAYRLGLINTRITQNRTAVQKANVDLRRSQDLLVERLRGAYQQPRPSVLQVVLSSRSVSAAMSNVEALDRTTRRDVTIIGDIKALRQRRVEALKQLEADKPNAEAEVADRARQRAAVEGLLARRSAVLSGAKGALATALAEEQARERERADAEARRARARGIVADAPGTVVVPTATPAPSSGSPSPSPTTTNGNPPGPAPTAPAKPSPATPAPAPAKPAPAKPAPAVPKPKPVLAPAPAPSSVNARAAQIAVGFLGVPYRWGGASPSGGFDCSGLANYAYGKVGVYVPHYTGAIWAKFPRVNGSLQPGDMVFYRGLGHMGIYIGGGRMVHAPRTGDVVKITAMSTRRDFVGAVRP